MAQSPQREPDRSMGGEADPSFEESFATLEAIVRQLEDGSLGLTQSLARYEEGIRCLKLCHETLRQAERRVELVTGVAADGTPVSAAFDEGDLTLDEKAQQRSRRRSKSDGDTDAARASKSSASAASSAAAGSAAAGSSAAAANRPNAALAAGTSEKSTRGNSTRSPNLDTADEPNQSGGRASSAGRDPLEDRGGPGRLFFPS